MKPLLFLTTRTVVNGIKRALTNPRRLIGLLFASFWLLRYLIFPFRGERAEDFNIPVNATNMLSHIDGVRVMDAIVFAFFMLMTFFLLLGALNTRGGFRPADVDVLFPTPIEPRLVLIFRIVRDYLLTLLTPLVFIIVGFRPASAGVKSLSQAMQRPEAIGQTLRFASGAWLLVALCWVCINYSASLFVNRSDLASDRNKRIMGWSLALILIGVFAFVWLNVLEFTSWRDAVTLSESPVLRIVFFTATLATWMIHGVVQGNVLWMLAGFGGLVAIILIAIRIALTQASWMYDQAAVRGFDSINTRKLQQQGDTIGLIIEQARRGKVKARRSRWISRINAFGPWALLWKEAIISVRSTFSIIIVMTIMSLAISLLPVLASGRDIGQFFVIAQAFAVFIMSSALSQAGFIEMLRRVDVQKPLPFSFTTTVLFEVLAKALPAAAISWIGCIVVIIARPSMWQSAIGSAIAMPFLAILLCAVTCLITILFPDIDDPTQRSFRGLMNLVCVVVTGAPAVGVFVVTIAIGLSPILAGLAAAVINIGISALVTSLAGNQYAQFNPSE